VIHLKNTTKSILAIVYTFSDTFAPIEFTFGLVKDYINVKNKFKENILLTFNYIFI
jgi:hypothetical protein